jgi:hypothetical protein
MTGMVVYWTSKDGTPRSDWEDGAAYSRRSGWFAVADGASTGSDSRSWAFTLARSVIADRPAEIFAEEGFLEWVRRTRAGFDPTDREFPASRTPHWVQAAASRRGAHATLLAGRLAPGTLDAVAVGDCCLFRRSKDRVDVFPMQSAGDFGTTPALVPSQPMDDRGLVRAVRHFHGRLAPGDVVYAASDALAEWLVRNRADDRVWRLLDRIGNRGFERLCADLRAHGQMKNDDTTLFRAKL